MTDETSLLLEAFAMEADDQVAQLERDVIGLEQVPGPEGWRAAAACFRLLAAAAEMMELSAVQALATHGLETAQALAADGAAGPLSLTAYREGVTAFKQLLAGLTVPNFDSGEVVAIGAAAFSAARQDSEAVMVAPKAAPAPPDMGASAPPVAAIESAPATDHLPESAPIILQPAPPASMAASAPDSLADPSPASEPDAATGAVQGILTPLGAEPAPALIERLARWRRGIARRDPGEQTDLLLDAGPVAAEALAGEPGRAQFTWPKARLAQTPAPARQDEGDDVAEAPPAASQPESEPEAAQAPAPLADSDADIAGRAPTQTVAQEPMTRAAAATVSEAPLVTAAVEPAPETPSLPVLAVAPELLAIFAEEVGEHLTALAENLATLRAQPTDEAALREVRRSLHTLKGAASMVGVTELHQLNWVAEETIEQRLEVGGGLTPALHTLLEATIEAIQVAREAHFTPRALTACAELVPQWQAVRHGQAESLAVAVPEPVESAVASEVVTIRHEVAEASTPADARVSMDEAPPAPADGGLDDAGAEALSVSEESGAAIAPAHVTAEPQPGDGLAAIFAVEAETGLQAIGELLTTLAEGATAGGEESAAVGASRQAILLELQRQLHTLKGAAAMMQQQAFATLAHQMEDVVERLAVGQLPATPAVVALLYETTGALEAIARPGDAVKAGMLHELTTRYRAVLGAAEAMRLVPTAAAESSTPAGPAGGTVRVDLGHLDQLMELAGELITNRAGFEERLTGLSGLLRDFERSVERLARVSRALEYDYEAWGVAGEQPAVSDDDFDMLEFDRYTEFHRLAGELAEAVADVRTISRDVATGLGSMTMLVSRQRRVTTALREGVETMRLMPLAGLNALARRIVRQTALAEGREVTVETSGLEAQVDRTIYETLTTALNHLLRNAVVHGIEPAAVRLAAGKPETGRITVDVRQEHYETVVTVRDDGGGIDRAAVRRAAEAQGWLQPGQEIDEHDLLRLIFRPRLSTTEAVDESAGRGVGLDAALAAVSSVRGRIDVESTPGMGATFTLRLPLVMVIGTVLLVECGGRPVALPMRWLERTLKIDMAAVRAGIDGPETLVEDEWLPVVALADLLGWPAGPGTPPAWPAVVVRSGERRAVVLVDALIQRQELAISTLGPSFGWLRAVQGATVLGSGQVAPVLDLAALLEQGRAVARAAAESTARPVRVLVVDDSVSVRRVVTMALERQGWQVVAARHGAEALELLATEPVDVALLDVEMPQMDGYTLLERLRASERYATLPVAMLTSRSADKHRERALQLGAQAYLVKPYREEELLATLGDLLHAGPMRAMRQVAPALTA